MINIAVYSWVKNVNVSSMLRFSSVVRLLTSTTSYVWWLNSTVTCGSSKRILQISWCLIKLIANTSNWWHLVSSLFRRNIDWLRSVSLNRNSSKDFILWFFHIVFRFSIYRLTERVNLISCNFHRCRHNYGVSSFRIIVKFTLISHQPSTLQRWL